MLIMSTNLEVVKYTTKLLGSNFDMKDLGETYIILVIKICKTSERLILNQFYYVEKIMRRSHHYDEKPVRTPYDSYVHIKKKI